ncbi:capsule biosynthesis protein [Defluviimonas sp. WL0075]|uniref:Capsule biosynthesis protein n=1 Tax=Albidovulum sediminicola TaxID=2984331 RepID=A0ABT2YXD2_9RHOB|nr:capsule biosynthesis protein [Defluviimonas sp. WL0075]MCV2863529.1 capsule biosynthesis protein [Defluviimonas sp. WL0075]
MQPKAIRFRIRRDPSAPARPAPEAETEEDDGFGDAPFPTTLSPAEDAEIASIRAEGLSGHQLRTAARIAQRRGFRSTSEFDAVRLLRKAGIDPFARAELVGIAGQPGAAAQATGEQGETHLPRVVPQPSAQVPAAPMGEGERAREILKMQREIVRRRRRALRALIFRLAAFIVLPTVIAGYYFFALATPLYATRSEFLIQQADSKAGGAFGGLLSGTQFATSQDSITVQSFLQSRDAMGRLDADLGFKAHFSQDWIDPIQRLGPDASNEEAYKLYRRNVRIGFDPTEGIVKLEVIAADPQTSQNFSEALIGYAEERVDNLSLRLREDQMQGAREVYEDAEGKLLEAQRRVQTLQEQLGVFDPRSESGAVLSQIATLELQAQEKRLQLEQLLDNARPNQARVEGVRGDISRIETMVSDLRAQLTGTTRDGGSLAAVTGEMRIAEHDLETRQMMLSQALQQLELARIEANRQVRYLSTGVRPIAPDEPTYPRSFENTALAFLIFAGIYLMLSLTVSILREQVSA